MFVCTIKWEAVIKSLQNLVAISPYRVMLITWIDFGEILLEFFFFFFVNLKNVFLQGQTLLATSQELLVQLMWNEKEVHELDTGWIMWPWHLISPMTLTWDVLRSNFKILGSCIRVRVRVWNRLISGMWMKLMWVDHSWQWVWPWWGGWMYRIVTGVTSDVCVPSTYLVWKEKHAQEVNKCTNSVP